MAMEEMYMRDGLHPSGKGTGVATMINYILILK